MADESIDAKRQCEACSDILTDTTTHNHDDRLAELAAALLASGHDPDTVAAKALKILNELEPPPPPMTYKGKALIATLIVGLAVYTVYQHYRN